MKKTKVWFLSTFLSIVLALSACALPAESTVQSSVSEDLSSDIQDREFAPQISESPFALSDICPYADQPYIVVNDNIPYFSEENLTTESFACYSDLDALGRCGVHFFVIDECFLHSSNKCRNNCIIYCYAVYFTSIVQSVHINFVYG